MAKLTAKLLIDGFWIVEESGNKIGTIKYLKTTNNYEFYDKRSSSVVELKNLDNFKIISNTTKEAVNDTVFGYRCSAEQAHNVDLQDTVPIYTKTATSSVYFAAGYYGILFPMGWRPSFCPRLKTLHSYEYIGPFKNEYDMQMAIKRKG